jgi:hypothetical protein
VRRSVIDRDGAGYGTGDTERDTRRTEARAHRMDEEVR